MRVPLGPVYGESEENGCDFVRLAFQTLKISLFEKLQRIHFVNFDPCRPEPTDGASISSPKPDNAFDHPKCRNTSNRVGRNPPDPLWWRNANPSDPNIDCEHSTHK